MSNPITRLVEWLGGHELVVLLGSLVVVAGTWGFFRLASEVREGETRSLDARLIRGLRTAEDPSVPIGPPWMEEVGRDVTALGSVTVIVIVGLIVVGYLGLAGKYASMAFVFTATAGGFALASLLKGYYRRPRPEVVPHLMRVYNSSFPSGHSMMAAVVYLTLGALLARMTRRRRLRFYCLAVAGLLTTMVGVSRVFMGVHYPSDVLAGWTAGLVWATLCWLVGRRLQRRGQIEPPGDPGDVPS